MKKIKIFLIFFFLSFLFHFLPNYNIPLHSDVAWFFVLQTSNDKEFIKTIPENYKDIAAYPQPLLKSLISWYEYSGRLNLLDIASLRWTAQIAEINANIWRFIYITFLSFAIGLFYLVSQKLKISNYLSLLFSLGLILYPLDIWTDYKTAEPRAIFFLMLSYFLILSSNKTKIILLSATSLFASVLTKETFLPATLVIPGLIFWKIQDKNNKITSNLKLTFKQLLPFIILFILFCLYIFTLKFFVPITNEGYIFQQNQNNESFIKYFLSTIPQVLPILLSGMWINLFIFTIANFCLFNKYISKINPKKFLIKYFDLQTLILSITFVIAIIFSILFYYYTGRIINGRYIVPSNFLTAILFGILFTPLTRSIYSKVALKKTAIFFLLFLILLLWPYRSFLYTLIGTALIGIFYFISIFIKEIKFINFKSPIFVIILLLILSLPQIDFLINLVEKNKMDQFALHNLSNKIVKYSPPNSHILLYFNEPNMIETAQFLEFNSLTNSRADLTFHFEVEDPTNYQNDSGFLKHIVNAFNRNRKPIEQSSTITIVKADRKGGGIKSPYNSNILTDFKTLITNPKKFYYQRYIEHKTPYLNYTIEIKT